MKTSIIISLEVLQKNSLTPNEFIYLYHLINNLKLPDYKIDLDKLEEKKFIKVIICDNKLKVYPRYYNIKNLFKNIKVESNDVDLEEAWQQLLKSYPKVWNKRRLHNKSVAKPKFKKVLKNHSLDIILKGLDNENKARESSRLKGEFFPDPKALSTWLNQEVFLDYLEADDEILEKPIDKSESI